MRICTENWRTNRTPGAERRKWGNVLKVKNFLARKMRKQEIKRSTYLFLTTAVSLLIFPPASWKTLLVCLSGMCDCVLENKDPAVANGRLFHEHLYLISTLSHAWPTSLRIAGSSGALVSLICPAIIFRIFQDFHYLLTVHPGGHPQSCSNLHKPLKVLALYLTTRWWKCGIKNGDGPKQKNSILFWLCINPSINAFCP